MRNLSGKFSNPSCGDAYALFFKAVSSCWVALYIGDDHLILFQYFDLPKRRRMTNGYAAQILFCHAERALTGQGAVTLIL
jgi:hypothetical protein